MSVERVFCRLILKSCQKVKRLFYRAIIEPIIKRSFEKCGHHVRVGENCRFCGIENISIGDHVSLGAGAMVMTTRAKVKLGNFIMFGPNVTIVTGDHRTDILGKYMCLITDKEKRLEDDQDVVIADDVSDKDEDNPQFCFRCQLQI